MTTRLSTKNRHDGTEEAMTRTYRARTQITRNSRADTLRRCFLLSLGVVCCLTVGLSFASLAQDVPSPESPGAVGSPAGQIQDTRPAADAVELPAEQPLARPGDTGSADEEADARPATSSPEPVVGSAADAEAGSGGSSQKPRGTGEAATETVAEPDSAPVPQQGTQAPQPTGLPAGGTSADDGVAESPAGGTTADDGVAESPAGGTSADDGVAESPAGGTEIAIAQDGDGLHDLSVMGMYRAADWVVKAVMIVLIVASVVTWTIWIAKSVEIAAAKSKARRAVESLNAATGIYDVTYVTDAKDANDLRGDPFADMLNAASDELRQRELVPRQAGSSGVKERVAARLSRIEVGAGRQITKGTGVLATIASTAPFVGLFGTVWGIMNSFIGISKAQTTNLAVVAPGIAEALLATGMGLFAAIPAVVIYNVFVRSIAGYRQLLGDAASAVERLVSRDLDFHDLPGGSGKRHRAAAE